MAMVQKKNVEDLNVAGKKVIVRVDFNVPLDKVTGEITDDKRIKGALPTIKYLLDNDAKVILCSHMGKPHAVLTEGFGLDKKEKKKVEALPVEEQAAAEPAYIAPINTAEDVRAEDGATFHIIVGSMPSAKGAQRAIKELSHKMDTEYSVVEGDRRFRIAVESFGNEKDANIALARIKKTFPDAWVLKR